MILRGTLSIYCGVRSFHQLKKEHCVTKEFQDDVIQQPSAAKREVSDTVEEIKGRDVINEMSR